MFIKDSFQKIGDKTVIHIFANIHTDTNAEFYADFKSAGKIAKEVTKEVLEIWRFPLLLL
jgi:hypothetical protein